VWLQKWGELIMFFLEHSNGGSVLSCCIDFMYILRTVMIHVWRSDALDGLDVPDTLDLTEPAVQRRNSARPYPFARG
jgi:hypothetical protein